jgi:hypothetical protein
MLTVVDTPKLQLMKSTSETTLGYVIAYVAPGAVSLGDLRRYSEEIRTWFGIAPEAETSVGGGFCSSSWQRHTDGNRSGRSLHF